MSGPQCAHNPPTLDPASGAGHVQQLGGLNTYVTGDQDSKLAVILLADAFGWEVPKLRKLADQVAASGFLVVVPDFYYGDQFTREKAGPGWVERHPPDRGCEDAKNIIAALKSKGVSKIGVAGFCWGGMVAVRLAKYDCIEAAVVLHPGPITVEEINEVKTPIAILGAEIDHIAPPEMIKRLGDVLSSKPEARN
ncbi:UNVERIFIED_CONTAM: Carboxymethylenebutenolidase [Sesamum radiatum]|uniref:Carboxymethylenebutenolidase n=1 Tax=Sesamum radiatum TaxID=300843 RepID=A0AAW2S9F2_SESRA